MKKWGWLALIFLGILIWQAWSIYGEAMVPKRSMVEKAFARAKEAVGLVDVKKVYTYYGDEACTVFIGRTKQEETDVVVWVPEKRGISSSRKQIAALAKRKHAPFYNATDIRNA